jgi:uncharacterized protein YxjI
MTLGGRRDRRRAERRAFGRGGSATQYRMKEKLLSFGDDYWIENSDGDRVFRVDGKALRLRQTLDLHDARGTHLCRLQTRVLHLRDTMAVESPDGSRIATVHKALVSPLRHRWKVDVDDGEDLAVQGNVVDHEYTVERDGYKVAEVSKRWFRARDTYGIQVAADVDVPLVLAVAVALDSMAHPD